MTDDAFISECRREVDRLSDGLIEIEREPDGETVDELFRLSHDLKGKLSMEGLDDASRLAHAIEDLLSAVRSGELSPPPAEVTNRALDAVVELEAQLSDADADDADPEAAIESLRVAIESPEQFTGADDADSDAHEDRRAAYEESDDDPTAPIVTDDDGGMLPDDFEVSESTEAALEGASEFEDLEAMMDSIDDEEVEELDELEEAGSFESADPDSDDDVEETQESADDDLSELEKQADEGGYVSDFNELDVDDDVDAATFDEEMEDVSFGQFDEDMELGATDLIETEAASGEEIEQWVTDSDSDSEPRSEEPTVDDGDALIDDEPLRDELRTDPEEAGLEEPDVDPDEISEFIESADGVQSDADASADENFATESNDVQAPVVSGDDSEEDEEAPVVSDETMDDLLEEASVDPSLEEDDESAASETADSELTTDVDAAPGAETDDVADADVGVAVDDVADTDADVSDADADVDTDDVSDTEPVVSEADAEPETETAVEDAVDPPDADGESDAEFESESKPEAEPEPEPTTADASDTDSLDEPVTAEDIDLSAADVEPTADIDPEEPTTDDGSLDEPAASLDDTSLESNSEESPLDSVSMDDISVDDAPSLDDVSLEDMDDDGEFEDIGFQQDEATEEFASKFGDSFVVEGESRGTPVSSLAESSLSTPEPELTAGAAESVETFAATPEQANELLSLAESVTATYHKLDRELDVNDRTPAGEALDQLRKAADELRDTTMGVRLTPLSEAFNGLQRVARNATRNGDEEKHVELTTDGEDVTLDRSIITELDDALVHLVRNAVDHGIEPAAERAAAGKSETGSVTVRAERRRDRAVIEVEDDGAGIDLAGLRETAVEAGVLSESEAETLSESETYELLFEAGLSTTEEVTSTSGRGVGLDAVDDIVTRLDGDISVESSEGEGTTITLTLPVTVSVTKLLFVIVNDEQYAIPADAFDYVGCCAEGAPGVNPLGPDDDPTTIDLRTAFPAGHGLSALPADGTSGSLGSADGPSPSAGGGSMTEGGTDVLTGEPIIELEYAPMEVFIMRGETTVLQCDSMVGTREAVVDSYDDVFQDIPMVAGATLISGDYLANVIDPEGLSQ